MGQIMATKDGEGLKRSVELDDTCWGDVGRREVGLGDGEVRGRSVELGGAGRSLEVNNEARKAESLSITEDVGMGGERENNLLKLDMTGHKDFFLEWDQNRERHFK